MIVSRVARRIDRRRRINRKLTREEIQEYLQSIFETDINIEAINKVMVIEKHKFLYNRVKKNANSYLSVVLNYVTNNSVNRVTYSRRQVPKLRLMTKDEIAPLCDYRRMIVVRCPYSRTLSAFLDKFRVDENRQAYGAFPLDPHGFRSFVAWLDDGGLSRNGHWDLQTKEILMPLDRYTDVIRFEDFEEKLPRFFGDVGIDVTQMNETGAFDRGRRHGTHASDRLKRFYDDRSLETVARLFATDFDALGYATGKLL